MADRFCSVHACFNSRHTSPGLSFFHFPKDDDRCKIWIQNCERFDLANKPAIKLNTSQYLVCGDHFQDDCFTNRMRNKLRANAVPTIFPTSRIGRMYFKNEKGLAYCCVPECKSRPGKSIDVTFHEFPCDQTMKERWVKNINRPDWSPSDRSKVCSKHFTPESYSISTRYRILLPNTLPLIFDHYPNQLTETFKSPLSDQSGSDSDTNKVAEREICEVIVDELVDEEDSRTNMKQNMVSKQVQVCIRSQDTRSRTWMKNNSKKMGKLRRTICRLKEQVSAYRMILNMNMTGLDKQLQRIIAQSTTSQTAAFLLQQIKAFGTKDTSLTV